jgi:flagellar basal-body rod protein FlgG
MVAMIAASRQFEQQMKSLQTAEQREQSASQAAGADVARLTTPGHPESLIRLCKSTEDGAQAESCPMIRSLWIAKTGMEGQQTKLDTISHNLANVGTNGYKRSHVVFEDLMYQNLRQAGSGQLRADDAAHRAAGRPRGARGRHLAQLRAGQRCSRAAATLDVAVKGQGFFQVQMPDGTTGYTRDGSFQVDATGQLVTNNGFAVKPGITIPANAQKVTIARRRHGQRHAARPGGRAGGGPDPAGQLRQPGRPRAAGQNLYAETAPPARRRPWRPATNGLGKLQPGFCRDQRTSTSSRSWWR